MHTQPLTYSESMYLYADQYIDKRSKFLNKDEHPSGEKITHTPLAEALVLAAFLYLMDNQYITLNRATGKLLFVIPVQKLTPTIHKDMIDPVGGVEQKLYTYLKSNPDVGKSVYYLLDEDETNPWGQIVRIVKDNLVQKGYLKKGENAKLFSVARYEFVKEKLQEAKPLYEKAKDALDQYKAQKDFPILRHAVASGISSRREVSSSDSD